MRLWGTAFLAVTLASAASAASVKVVRYSDNGAGDLRVVSATVHELAAASEGLSERSFPRYIAEHQAIGAERIVELRSASPAMIDAELLRRGVKPKLAREDEGLDEVVTLVDSGPVANRIDLVFMGDGYTAAEREKFFSDIQRMVNDMFASDTFRSYLPLFNVHAVYRPSNESGIGRNNRPKDTAYKLAREGETLRAIYPGDSAAAQASCDAAPGCDYPVIIGNDPYYGGLGGQFAISTSSVTSGTVVLRHELGHNFGQVGEEYDGGGYFGQNVSNSVSSLKWSHWATEGESVRAEPSKARFLAWPWHNLSRGPYSVTFDSDGNYATSSVRFSASGIATADTLRITIDGEPFAFTPRGDDDRAFYDYDQRPAFSRGRHELKFVEGVNDGNNWVSSLTVHEFGADYHHDNTFVGAFPLFNRDNSVGAYRATNEACLMRDMTSRHFCPICQENNWLEFFGKVKMIDAVDVERAVDSVNVALRTQQVGQFRSGGNAATDGTVKIKWLRNGSEVPALRDQATWSLPTRDATGRWEVEVEFATPEVRRDAQGLLKDRKQLDI